MITGTLTKVEIPAMVKPGAVIQLTVAYTAQNPGAVFWSTCIMSKVGTDIKIVSTTKEVGANGGGEHSYNLQNMPGAPTTVTIKLFGHNDAGHIWTISDWK